MRFRGPNSPVTNTTGWRDRRGPTQLSRLTRPASTIYITDFFDDAQLAIAREIQGNHTDMEIGQYYDLCTPSTSSRVELLTPCSRTGSPRIATAPAATPSSSTGTPSSRRKSS